MKEIEEETTQFVPPLQDEENAEIEPIVLTETEPKQINEEQEEEIYTLYLFGSKQNLKQALRRKVSSSLLQ